MLRLEKENVFYHSALIRVDFKKIRTANSRKIDRKYRMAPLLYSLPQQICQADLLNHDVRIVANPQLSIGRIRIDHDILSQPVLSCRGTADEVVIRGDFATGVILGFHMITASFKTVKDQCCIGKGIILPKPLKFLRLRSSFQVNFQITASRRFGYDAVEKNLE